MNNYSVNISNEYLFPYRDHYTGNPLSTELFIKNRPSGYRPIIPIRVVTITKEKECTNVFQSPCDTIVPRNMCYRKHRTITLQP